MRLYCRIKNFFVYGWDKFRARFQRFKRGYSYRDVWDMDYWFIRTVCPMLTNLRDYGISLPSGLSLPDTKNNRKVWEDILTEMIELLNLMDEDGASEYLGIADNDYSHASRKKVYALMVDSKNRFFELFSKYFFDLWD